MISISLEASSSNSRRKRPKASSAEPSRTDGLSSDGLLEDIVLVDPSENSVDDNRKEKKTADIQHFYSAVYLSEGGRRMRKCTLCKSSFVQDPTTC